MLLGMSSADCCTDIQATSSFAWKRSSKGGVVPDCAAMLVQLLVLYGFSSCLALGASTYFQNVGLNAMLAAETVYCQNPCRHSCGERGHTPQSGLGEVNVVKHGDWELDKCCSRELLKFRNTEKQVLETVGGMLTACLACALRENVIASTFAEAERSNGLALTVTTCIKRQLSLV